MRGHKRFRAGAWRLTVNAADPITGKRKPVYATVHAPNNKRGAGIADSELAKLVTEVEAGRELPHSGLTCGQLLERWVTSRRTAWENKSPGQADETLRRIHRDIIPHIGDVDADKVVRRPILLADMYEKLRAKCSRAHQRNHECANPDHECRPWAESTVRRVHDIVHAGFGWGSRHDIITRNPADHVDPPRVNKPKKKRPPEPATVARLIDKADLMLGTFVRVSALNGSRRGQTVALRWSDLDLDGGNVMWSRALAKVRGGTAVKGTKSDNEWPSSIDFATVLMLTKLRQDHTERAAAVGIALSADAYVFSDDPAGRKPWHPDGATYRFRALCKRLGIAGVTLKDLRDYMATELLGAGVDPKIMAERGGWTETTTPLNRYAGFRPARDRDAAETLARGIDG